MKKITLLFLCAILYFGSQAQTYGGQIKAKNSPGVIGDIGRANDALKVWDSANLAKTTIIAGAISSGKMQVDVISMPSTTVTATNLDIHDLAFATDKVDVSGSTSVGVTGTFWQATQPVSISGNQAVNVAQINGVTPLMGAGNTGTGSQRVTIASDQVAIPVTVSSTTITGTVAVTKSGTWDITNAGTFVVQENGAALTALQLIDDNMVAQGTALGSTKNALIGGSVTTAAPSYTTGQINPFSLQTDGSLRAAITNTVTVGSHAVTNAGTFATQVDGAALTALQLIDNLPNTLGSTTSGQSGALALGAVTTAAPSYTTAQSNALSLTTAGALRVDNSAVTQPVSGTVSITANSAVNVAQINGVTTLMGNGTTGTGSQRVTLASDMTAISTTGYMSVKFDQTTPGTTNGVSLVPTTTGGLTTYHLVSAASTNATNVKASAGQLYGYYIFNANASARKIAFHNSASAPTAGASVFFSVVIPASSGANVEFSQGIPFSSGIGITTVTGTADSDATGVAAGDLIINLFYK